MNDLFLIIFIAISHTIALVYLLSGIDDVTNDVIYWTKARRSKKLLDISDFEKIPQKNIAIMVPAWREEDVIDKMIINAFKMVDYKNYDIFVGAYPNDGGTQKSLEEILNKNKRVHLIINKKEGPTNKAQNLNSIYYGIKDFENKSGKKFDILVIQDSEDIIHPLSLKLFNFLIPPNDMVQIPVFPIESEMNFKNFFKYLTSATYADEFAENHTKDIIVRKYLKGIIPSAGVGTAFSKISLGEVARKNEGYVFNENNITEDYEFSIRLNEEKMKSDYVVEGVRRVDNRGRKIIEYISTREFFPNTLSAAIRQKSRWVYGITFQTPRQHTLRGKSFSEKYSLLRDRKARYLNLVNLPAYGVFIYCVYAIVYSYLTGQPSSIASKIFPLLTPIWFVVVTDSIIAVERMINRFAAVKEIYGKKHATTSALIPPILSIRLVWGNIINFFATLNAWGTFIFGGGIRNVKWKKTVHKSYAPEEILNQYKRKLGDLLLENKIVKEDELIDALKFQRITGTILGAALLAKGYITKNDLNYIRAKQLRSYPDEIRLEDLDLDLINLVPEVIAKSGKVLPIGKLNNSLLLAKVEEEKYSFTESLEEKTDMKVEYVTLSSKKLEPLIEEAYRLAAEKKREEDRFGNMLIRKGLLNKYQLDIALELQKKIGGRIGKVLTLLNFISEEDLAKSLSTHFGIEYMAYNNNDVDKNLTAAFPEEFARVNLILPIKYQDDKIVFVLNNPLNFPAINKIKSIFNEKIKPVVGTESNIISLLNYSYGSIREKRKKGNLN